MSSAIENANPLQKQYISSLDLGSKKLVHFFSFEQLAEIKSVKNLPELLSILTEPERVDLTRALEKFSYTKADEISISISTKLTELDNSVYIKLSKLENSNQVLLIFQIPSTLVESVEETTPAESEIQSQILDDSIEKLAYYQEQLLIYKQRSDIAIMLPEFTHEINTPIGICVTANSMLSAATEGILQKLDEGKLSKPVLEKFLHESVNSQTLLESNINRANELIASFKQVTVDQQSENIRLFPLNQLFNDTLNTLRPRLKKTLIEVITDCSSSICLTSMPGPLSQVLINLINNSLTHAFEQQEEGRIKISVFNFNENDTEILLIYADNGKGMTEETLEKLFIPFFTTNSANGNTGLGMSICLEIVEGKLKGEFLCNSLLGTGTEFYIRIPINIESNLA
ncbi:sensor histidine kinase [Catenovulum maritimum]|uniref:sensor histidine kinase n=1 Tax=Catenovulum maritimum TaxID=1513271 RepID=UPI00065FA452|nr:HAMP domain-containing sensor histidine kinase [Catenovulum maritimum]